ncbi:hypothetical protein B0H13DRAFT_2537112 [Mycena leptocephala]|nr:hypothetical protein B0H13DRAFT_2537112 [Mycena leptocephala]
MASFGRTANPDHATFLGFGLEGVGYGTSVLIGRQSRTKGSGLPIFALTCWMLGLVTVHYALNFNNVYNGLMVDIVPHIAEETHLLAGADMIFMISDFQIYRCYLVWGKTLWVIILPLFIAFATVSCGLALVGLVLSISPTAPQAPEAIVPMGTATFAISLVLNLMVIGLIVGRIWWMTRDNRKQGVPHSKKAL